MSKKYKKLIPIFIVLIGGIYLFYFPSSVDKEELKQISGILVNSPVFHDVGIPGNKSVDFKLENHSVEFDIESCSYDNLNAEKFLSLRKGDSVILMIKKKRTLREKFNRDIDCHDVRSTNGEIYLNLSESNVCFNNSWKIILAMVFLYILISSIEKLIKK